MKHLFTLTFYWIIITNSQAQPYLEQYFDGEDTIPYMSIFMEIDTSGQNVWEIGEPEKILFDTASTYPNVIITDLDSSYPTGVNSSFLLPVGEIFWDYGIAAISWSQKIDFEYGAGGGLVEYWSPEDSAWINAFTSPYIYNYYGFDEMNVDTLVSGEIAFTGTDTSWKDIWLCMQLSYLYTWDQDSIWFRFHFIGGDTNNYHEGWMMDNFRVQVFYGHTIKSDDQTEYISVSPNLTNGPITIETQKINSFHIIESIQVINLNGEVVKEYGICPTRFNIQIDELPSGIYYLRIKTNLKTESFPVVLMKG